MSQESRENRRYTQQLDFLTSLTPKYLSLDDLNQLFASLHTHVASSKEPTLQFNNLSLLNSDDYRSEALQQVDRILEKYEGDTLSKTTDVQISSLTVEKDLLWASLQLFAYLQAIEQEVGLIQDPKTQYCKSLEKLEICQALLRRNRSDNSKITSLLQHKPEVLNVINGQWYEKAFNDFISYIDDRNNTRLFWVWGRPNLDMALEYAGQVEARARLADTTYIPGQISWGLYLFRGSFFAIKMFNKWWNNPAWLKKLQEAGLTEAEYAEYRTRYLIAYWNVYKYRILNDYVWGPINLGTFEWWVGEGLPGWFGDFATCFLLCMDIYLADLLYREEANKYQTIQNKYIQKQNELSTRIVQKISNGVKRSLLAKHRDFNDINNVEDQISFLRAYLDEKAQKKGTMSPHDLELIDLLHDLNEAQQDQQDHMARWRKKERFLHYDRVYTKALLFVFAMAVAFLVGGLLPTAVCLFLTKSGTILCLALTILYRTMRAQLQISQSKDDRTELQIREDNLLKEFSLLKNKHDALNPDAKNIKEMHNLYLSIMKTGAQIDYHTASIRYQYLELARTTLLRFSIPALIGLTLVYVPATLYMVPTYVFVLLACAVFAYVLDRCAKQYKPDETPIKPKFDSAQYQTFFAAPRVYSQPINEGFFALSNAPTLSAAEAN